MTQTQLGDLVGLGQSEISHLERGFGARSSIETWIALGIALRRPIAVGFGRDVVEPLNDAGHLGAQELVARLATVGGWRIGFEAIDDPRAPTGHSDLRLERGDQLVLIEIWNRLDDFGAAARSSDRKLAAVRRSQPSATSLWLLIDTAANRQIVRRHPSLLRARLRGSSADWVRAIVTGTRPPSEPGLAWIDVRSARIRELRLPE